MPKWVETSWIRRVFGDEHSSSKSDNKKWVDGIWESNHWRPNYKNLDECLNDLMSWCNEEQYSVKSVLPLTRAQSYEYGQNDFRVWSNINSGSAGGWGLGFGWGVSNIIGFAALVERVEEISQEEYEKRTAKLQNQRTLKNLKALVIEIDKKLAEIIGQIGKLTPVASAESKEKKGLLGGIKYLVLEDKYDSLDEAQKAIDTAKASMSAAKAAQTELKAEKAKLEAEIAALTADED